MINMIQEEINNVKNITISNTDELEILKQKYLSKDGIIPSIYKIISNMKGDSSYYLGKMLELRGVLDEKIKTIL